MITRLKECFVNGEKSSDSITKSAVIIAVMGLASKILGLLRDRILASKFGAGDVLDVYYAAFKIPDLVYSLLILGALSAAFVPVFTSLSSRKKEKEAWELTNTMLSGGVLILMMIIVVLYFFIEPLTALMTFGYSEEKQIMVAEFTRIMLFSPLIMGISGIVGGVLNSFKKFFFYSLAPIFYNLGIIFGAYFLASEDRPIALAYGVVLGAFLHLSIQIPEFFRCGFRLKPSLDFKNKYFREVLILMGPRAMGLAVAQVNLLVITILASTLESGSLAIFNFANNLQSVPLGLFGISFAIAAFPTLSCLWAQEKKNEFIQKFSATLRKIWFLIIPCSALIFVLRAQIVRLILGTGNFDWNDTVLTLNALGIFVFSLWAQSAIPLLARSFYAIHNTMIPFSISLLSEFFNIFLAIYLIGGYGVLGLVWAFTVSTSLNAFLLFVFLRIKVGSFGGRKMMIMLSKVIVATFFLILASQSVKNAISANPFGEGQVVLGVMTQFLISAVSGILVFVLVGKFLKIRELDYFINLSKSKIFKSSKKISSAGIDREELGN